MLHMYEGVLLSTFFFLSPLQSETRRNGALQCLQLPGDVLYIPENWGHSVINLYPSVAVAMEFH